MKRKDLFELFIIYGMGIMVVLNLLSCKERIESPVQTVIINENVRQQVIGMMIDKFGEEQRPRIEKGVSQVAQRWRKSDGTTEEFGEFCLKYFETDPAKLDILLNRYQSGLESLYGNLHRIYRDFNWNLQVDTGPIQPVDYLFASYDVYAHVNEDIFKSKLAPSALLNFPIYSLEEKNSGGESWTRKQWAEARLTDKFINRVPADVEQQRTTAYVLADDYISNYNIYMHNLLNEQGERLFPEGLKLISHWGLRDELKAQYANSNGLPRQKMIQQVMERIITQQIPQVVINNPEVDWNPFSNEVFKAGTTDTIEAQPESRKRYEHLWNIYQAERRIDPFTPETPSLIDRRFKQNREIPEEDVEAMLISLLTSPVLKDVAGIIKKRLGQDLQPFDIWYNGFKARGKHSEAELDAIVSKEYPDVKTFEADLPFILRKLGFAPETAKYLAEHIAVDPSRGAGHAMGARMRSDKAHLRTRIPEGGMKYKGYNIAIHELGHNVEQVFSMTGIDYYTLEGVPNTAFTEALAFVFQARDLSLLGLETADPQAETLRILDDIWSTYEIAGVSLVDMKIWRWMYENPNAGPEALRDAMVTIAREVWNSYFAPVFGMNDQILLAVYSHIIDGGMYIPDYFIGSIIAFQVEDYMKGKSLAREMERMCKLGRLTPQLWMKQAVGAPISAQALIDAAGKAVARVKGE
ncbi:MAG: hypothetical protein ACE5GL_06010 [Calditrichia bacterium]